MGRAFDLTLSTDLRDATVFIRSTDPKYNEGKHVFGGIRAGLSNLDEMLSGKNVYLMSGVSHGLEYSLSKNFTEQGAFLGRKWQNLSATTRLARAHRGYNQTEPILVQSGHLRAAVLAPFQIMARSSGAASGDGVNSAWSIRGKSLSITVSGAKVENQYGGMTGKSTKTFGGKLSKKKYGTGFLPPRPFFYLNQRTVDLCGATAIAEMIGAIRMDGIQRWTGDAGIPSVAAMKDEQYAAYKALRGR